MTRTIIVLGFLSSCTSRENRLFLEAPLLSQKHQKLPDQPLVKGDYVQVQYCPGREVTDNVSVQAGWLGLPFFNYTSLEQLLIKAHRQSEADYFQEVTVYERAGCFTLRGHAARFP